MKNYELYQMKKGLEMMPNFRATKFNYFRMKVLDQLRAEIKVLDSALPELDDVKKEYQTLFLTMAEKENNQPVFYIHQLHPLLGINLPKVVERAQEYEEAYNALERKWDTFFKLYVDLLEQDNEIVLRTIDIKDLPTGTYTMDNGKVIPNELSSDELLLIEQLIKE